MVAVCTDANGDYAPDFELSWANAALIVEAVNAYDALRAENERLREALRDAKWTLGSIANAVRLGGYAQACVDADAGRSRVSAALSEPAQ